MPDTSSNSNGVSKGQNQTARSGRSGGTAKLVIALTVLGIAIVAWWQLGKYLQLDQLADAEAWLRSRANENPMASGLVAFLTYVIVTGLSLPFALVLTLTISWLLGFGWSLVVISFGSTIGATLAMLVSRHVLREWVRRRMGQRFGAVLSRLDQEGEWYLATLRLAPPVPFFAINLLAGLTRIRVRDYFWISQLCMLPATAVYCWVGASLPGLKQLGQQGPGTLVSRSMIIGLCAMAVLPFVIRFFLRRNRVEKTAGPTGT